MTIGPRIDPDPGPHPLQVRRRRRFVCVQESPQDGGVLARSLAAAALAVAVAVVFALSGQIAASADSSMTIAVMGQQDPAWAGAPLGSSPTETIGSAGCAITAVT